MFMSPGGIADTTVARPTPKVRLRGFYEVRAKRALDLALALALLPAALPLVGFAALLVWISGGAPFYAHERVGRGGRVFRCWKLRTMHRDGDRVLALLLDRDADAREEWFRRRKLAHDPRITRIGRLLRLASIDDLPQLLNVLRGEMSIVGPRPVTRAELARYGAAAPAYMRLAPGITGLWQVGGRNGLSLDERIARDAAYAERLSLGLDLGILARTPAAVLRGGG